MATLAEQYRPRSWDDVAGQEQAVKAIRAALKRGWGSRAWWITGASGQGKTTLAKLIAQEGASAFATDEIDAGSLTPAALREIEKGYRCKPLPMDDKTGCAIIVNECHRLRRDTVAAFLDVLERLPSYVVFIFTTTKIGQESLFEDDVTGDCAPLVSRCIEVVLSSGSKTRAALAARAKMIAQKEGIDGLPDDVYASALDDVKGNLRALLTKVESGQLNAMAIARAKGYLCQPASKRNAEKTAAYQELLAKMGDE